MTTIRIPPLVSDGTPGGAAACRVSVRLVDARRRNLIGLRTLDGAPVTAYYGTTIEAGGDSLDVDLTPQSAIESDVETYYLVTITAEHVVQSWLVQVPESAEVVPLADLVAGAAVPPGDILAGRLLPDASGEPDDRYLATLDGAWVPVNAPSSGIPEAPLTDGPYGRQAGDWTELTPGAIGAATEEQGSTADTAVQPGDLATVATSGAYADLSGTPTLGTAAAADAGDFATAAQGSTADTAVQPGDLDDLDLIAYTEDGSTASIQSGGTLSVPLDGGLHEHTLAAAVTAWSLTAPTAPRCGSAVVILIQAAGGYAVAWPSGWYWPDGTAPTMPATAGARLELVLRSTPGGSIYASGASMAVPA